MKNISDTRANLGGSRPFASFWPLLALCSWGPADVLAQGTPAATLPNVQQLTPALPKVDTDRSALPAPPLKASRELARPGDDLRLDVQAYEIEGGPPELQAALAALTAPYIGPARSHGDLLDAAAAVTRHLQATLGYYLGYAYIPAQKPVGGRVRIQVLEGRLDRVVVEAAPGLRVDRDLIDAVLAPLQPGKVLLIAEVERVVFLLNDLQGLSARFEFREGREWGTAELHVRLAPEAAWQRRVDLDADGSRYSGVVRLAAQALLTSPFGRGDALTLSSQVSTTGGLAFGLAGYTLPVGSDGLKLGVSLSAFRYRFDKNLLPQDVRGNAQAGTVYALYPVKRTRNLNLFALASLEHKRFDDKQGDGNALQVRKHTDEVRLGLSGDFRDEVWTGGVNTYELSANIGRVAYDVNAPTTTDDAKRFTKISFGGTRLQNLLTNSTLLYANLRGQFALANLDATQQMRLGGADGVRAFAPGDTAGDNGLLLTVEVRSLLPEAWFGRQGREFIASVFYDAGRVQFRHDTSQRPADFRNSASLGGAGFGLVWERQRDFNARVFVAWSTFGQATGDTAVRRPRVYAQFSKSL